MRFVWVCLSVVVGGCNWLYGLDETHARGPDLDGDGISEGDNCPALANTDQADMDRDGVGDVCDPCVTDAQLYVDADRDGVDDGCDLCARGPSQHDEDGDGHLDDCDNCPGVANAAQTDGDGDGIGDACDLHGDSAQRRVRFAGFDELPPAWIANLDRWTVADDAVGPAMPPTSGTGFQDGLWNRTDGVAGLTWSLETQLTLPSAPPNGYTVGLALRTRSGGVLGALCTLEYTGEWRLASGGAFADLPEAPANPVRLRLVRAAGSDVRCEIVNGPSTTNNISAPELTYTPVLFTERNGAAFHYADLVE